MSSLRSQLESAHSSFSAEGVASMETALWSACLPPFDLAAPLDVPYWFKKEFYGLDNLKATQCGGQLELSV